MQIIKQCCVECDCAILHVIPTHPTVTECRDCGHPNDVGPKAPYIANTTEYLEDVAEFHRTFNSPILASPQIPDQARCELRVSLLQEELKELVEGIANKDIVEVADALADLQYVLSGAILEFGLQNKFPALFAEVHRSNMSKACTSHGEAVQTCEAYQAKDGPLCYIVSDQGKHIVYRIADHKTLKSINYSPADLKSIIES